MTSNSFSNFATLKISQINKINSIYENHYINFNAIKSPLTILTQLENKNMIN